MRLRASSLIVIATGFGAACSPTGPAALVVTATVEDSVASPENPAVIRVTARNVGMTRVAWGPGSSSCQLWLRVRVDGRDAFAPVDRGVCTMDLATHSLGPGESRTEVLPWAGDAQLGDGPGSIVRLDPGTYELLGFAPPHRMSAPVRITVAGDS